MKKINFHTETRKIKDLIDCKYNPRTLSKKQYQELLKSFKKFGYVEICAINTDNTIIAGHQRVHIMKDLGWEDQEIEVRVPNRFLEKDEFDEYLIRSNLNKGDWDFDILANEFEPEILCEFGFEPDELGLNDNIEDIENVDEVNESCNFIIKCSSIVELEELQAKLGTSATKIKYEDFIEKI